MRKVYPIMFLLALIFSLIAFAGVSLGQSNVQYVTCPSNNTDNPNQVVLPFSPVDVTFNQDIEYAPPADLTGVSDVIYMTADNFGDLTGNLDVQPLNTPPDVLWLLDPSTGDSPLPANDTIHVHIPASWITDSNGNQILDQDIDFTFYTGDYEPPDTSTTYLQDHYLFNFVTPLQTPPSGSTATLTVVKTVYGRSDVPVSDFTLHVSNSGGEVGSQGAIAGGNAFTGLPADTYTVSETNDGNAPSGYTTTFGGFDDNTSGTIALAAGVAETVYITDTYPQPSPPTGPTAATLTVVKEVYGSDTPPSAFSLHVLSGGSDVTDVNNPNFKSPQPGSETGTSYTLDGGTYTVSEAVYNSVYGNVYGSYTPSFSGFDSSDSVSGTVYLVAGGARTVTVINQYTGNGGPSSPTTATLTVVKHVYSGTAVASDFTLYVKNSDGTVVEQGPGSETGTSYTLDGGTYSVSESVSGNVYGNVYGSYTPSFSGFDSSDSVSGTVYLVAGGARTVTVINQYTGGGGGNPSGGSPSGGNPSGGNPSGGNPSGGNPSGGNPAPTPGENPNAASPPGPPKLPKTGVDPGVASVPWQVPAGILVITVFSFVVVQRKRIFSR